MKNIHRQFTRTSRRARTHSKKLVRGAKRLFRAFKKPKFFVRQAVFGLIGLAVVTSSIIAYQAFVSRGAVGGNKISAITTVTGTTGTAASTTVNFSGGTQLNKMFHFCSFSGNVADSLHDQLYRGTELTAIDTLTIYAGQTGGGNQNLTYRCYIVSFSSDSDVNVARYSSQTLTDVTNVAISTVSGTDRTFVIPHGETVETDTSIGSEENFDYTLTSTTNVAVSVDTGLDSDLTNLVRFEVVDWGNADIRVQHIQDQAMTSGQTSDTATIPTAVNLSKTWMIMTGHTNGSGFSEETGIMSIRGDLQNTTTVRARRGASGIAYEWSAQIIEDVSTYGLWRTQIGNISMGTGATSGTLTLSPAMDTANTMVWGTTFTNFSPGGATPDTSVNNVDNAIGTVTLTNSTTVTATRGVTDTQTWDIFVQAIEFLPAITQSAYRFYNNLNSTDVGTTLAAQDSAATLPTNGQAFRLRMLLHNDNVNLTSSGRTMKLQFAVRSGTCDTSFTGETYADVTGATAIAYNNNASPADGATLTSNANDPTHSGHTIVNQTYEESNNFTNNVAAIPYSQDGKWDFSLIDNDGTSTVTYCFRVVNSDNTLLSVYSVIPEVTTPTVDVTPPTLSNWTLNMSTGVLTMNFSETVNVSTLNVTGITVQNAATATSSYTLTDSTTASPNGTSIAITLSATDLAAIQNNDAVGTATADSYLRITSSVIDDIAGNDVTAIPNGSAQQVNTYTRGTTYSQAAYRLFANLNSTNVGSALAAQDTSATLTTGSQAFRLRALLHANISDVPTSADSFKLQFAERSGACDTSFAGETYADVTAATIIAYNNNATPADGATLTVNGSDPTHSGHTVVTQTYEELNNFTNSVAVVEAGQDGKWDFSLIDNGATQGATYCLRIVTSAGAPLTTYSVIPEVTMATSTFNETSFRFFGNSNSTDVGSALAAQNTAAALSSNGAAFRLRSLIHVGNKGIGISGQSFKLQFAQQSGSCDTGFVGETYADVTGASAIAFNDNSTPIDGAALTSNGADPTHGGDVIRNQSYEEGNNFTNAQAAIAVSEDGKWDFALIDNDGIDPITYCFRVVKADGSPLDTYTNIPQVTTADGNTAPTGTFNSAVQKTDGSGLVDISIEVDDTNDDDVRVRIEYETDSDGGCGGPWAPATLVGPATADFIDSGGVPDVNNGNSYQVGSGTNTRIITSSGSNTVTFDWDSDTDLPSANGTQCLRMTANDDGLDQTTPATFTLQVDNIAPTVTAGNLTIDDTACMGTGGVCIVGDVITFEWDNSVATGDNNADITLTSQVVFDLSDFGGSSVQNPGSVSAGIFSYDFTVTSGTIDATSLTFDATVTDAAGNSTGPITSTDTADLDNNPPDVTAGNISVSGATGFGGVFIIGDTVTVTWNAAGEPETDLGSAIADLSDWGGSSTAAMTDTTACGGTAGNNIWEACFTLVSGAIDIANAEATVTATDNAGNVTGPVADGTLYEVDTDRPTLTTWSIDLDAGTITFVFDETVDASTLDVTGITVQDAATATTSYTLTNSTTASLDGATIIIDLSATDLDAIKADDALATALATSYTVIFSNVIKDLPGNENDVISDGAGLQASAYTATPEISLSAYRFYDNIDGTDVGAPLVAQDTPVILAADMDDFRIRFLLHTSVTQLPISGEDFKLQFAVKSGACDTGFVGETYADVTPSTLIAYHDHASPADGDALTPNANDPTHGAHTIADQSYEELNPMTNSEAVVPAGQDGLWDLSLADNDGVFPDTYCLRIVYASGALLETYSVIPEVESVLGNVEPEGTFNSAVQKIDGSGLVDVSIDVIDQNDENTRVKVEYEADSDGVCNGPWLAATLVGPAVADFNDTGGAPDVNNGNTYQVGSGATTQIVTVSGSNTVQFDWDSQTDLPSANGNQCLRLTANDLVQDDSTPDTIVVAVDNTAPTVTAGNLTIDDTACTGTGGVCIVGDVITFEWDNSAATGDNNADVSLTSQVEFDLSAFGGSANQEPDSVTADVFTYMFTVMTGTLDASGLTFDVTATDDTSNTSSPITSTDTADLDNNPPDVTAGNISVSGATGFGGVFIIGDTVTVTWNAAGEPETDLGSAIADLSDWGGSSTATMTDTTACGGTAGNNIWEACFTLVSGAIDIANAEATVTATDNAGNVTGPVADGTLYEVDTDRPTLTTWLIDLDAGTITFVFDETVDASTLDVTGITVQDAASAGSSYTLTNSSSASGDGTIIVIDLSATDLAALKGNDAIATALSDSYLTLAGTVIDDLQGNANASIANGAAQQAFTYVGAIEFAQSAFRLFSNANSTDVGAPLAAQDAAATLGMGGDAFRLRALIHMDVSDLATSEETFKLQFAEKSGACDTGFTGETYADVTAATVVAYHNNPTPADGAALTGNANDPTHGGHAVVDQTYEELNNFTNSITLVEAGEDGMWDFALKDNGGAAGASYCLRVVKSNGALLNSYAFIPEVMMVEPTYEQTSFRFFNNDNSTDVGAPLAAQNTAAALPINSAAFRLRALMHIDANALSLNGEDFKLQFATKSGTCDTGFSGETYADVTGVSAIAFNNNSLPADGVALTANGGDPTHGGDAIRNQTYEEANNFTNNEAVIGVDEDGKWDFALLDNDGAGAASYCFRMVRADGSPLDTYTNIPEVSTIAGNSAPTGAFNAAVQKTDGSGLVDVSVEIDDIDDDDTRVKIEFETDSDGGCGGPWAAATLVGPATADFNDSGGAPDVNNTNAYQVGSGANTRIITSSGSNTITFDWESDVDLPSANGTQCLRLTANDDAVDQGTPALFLLSVDNIDPTVTAGEISVAGGTGTGGAFIIGDVVTVTWDNSAGGDNNPSLSSVTTDISDWGGSATATMTDTTACGGTAGDNIYEACFTLVSGGIDTPSAEASVTAADTLGNSTTMADGQTYTVDNDPPNVTAGNISVIGATGNGGEFIIGDTIVVSWDGTAGGDNEIDGLDSLFADLSDWGGSAAATMTDTTACGGTAADGIYEACYTIPSGVLHELSAEASVTITDNAGNTTGPVADGQTYEVHDEPPNLTIWTLNMVDETLTLMFALNVSAASLDVSQITIQDAITAGASYTLTNSTTASGDGTTIVIDLSAADLAGLEANDLIATSITDSYITMTDAAIEDLHGNPNVEVSDGSAQQAFAYTQDQEITLSAYRLFANTNTTDVGAALASQDASAVLSADGAAFRLRALLHVGVSDIFNGDETFKLQYAERSGTCDAGFTGETYADVTAVSSIAYNDNPLPADGDNLTGNANDPTHGGDPVVDQDYEELNNFTNTVAAVEAGEDGLWDFALVDNDGASPVDYCLRIVRSSGATLESYGVIAQVSTSLGSVAPTGSFVAALQKTDGSGAVDLSFEIDDINDDDTRAKIEYETDSDGACNGPWAGATVLGPATVDFDDAGGAPDVNNGNAYQVGSGVNTRIITSSGSNTVDVDWDSATDVPGVDGTQCLRMTANDDVFDQDIPDTITVSVDNVDPIVTAGNITVVGATGTAGAFIVGDIVTVTWDNSAGGDNNADLDTVTADLSDWGGSATATMTDTTACGGTAGDGIYEVCHMIVSGTIDTTTAEATVTATDTTGNSTATPDGVTFTVDNDEPNVTAGNISVAGATGVGGAFIVGDTVTVTWNGSAGGDNETDTLASVLTDLSDWGGSATATMTDTTACGGTAGDGIYEACYTLVAGAITTAAAEAAVTIEDNAGNVTGPVADGATFSADTDEPVLLTWTLNMAAETLTLNFDQTVDASTLDVTAITIQDATTATTSYTLTDSTTASGDGTSIVINLSATDLAALEADNGLATAINDSYLTMISSTINDLSGNNNVAIADGAGQQTFTYTQDQELAQSGYRLFDNLDSTDVGSALAAQDTPATLASNGEAFRLRMLLHVDVSDIANADETFKLQFATRSGTCDTGFSGETYADVTGVTAIAYNNNASPADGDNLTGNANDPVHGAHPVVDQDYEELNNFTNTVATIEAGEDGLWDFSLIDNNGIPAETYCFRIVHSSGSLLETYSVIPEVEVILGNSPPTGIINSATQKTDGSGGVDISVEADDIDDEDTRAKIEYETDSDGACNGPWAAATLLGPATADVDDTGGAPDVNNANAYQVGSTATTRIITSSGSNTVDFDWDSATDLPTADGTQCLRLTVNDDIDDQTTPDTFTVIVDNVDPAPISVSVAPPTGTAAVGDTVIVTVDMSEIGLAIGACTLNGVDVSGSFTDEGDNTYTLSYTLSEGDADWTASNLPLSCIFIDGLGNDVTVISFTDGNTLAGDANSPVISDVEVSPPSGTVSNFDTVTVTLTENNLEVGLTVGSCTVNGVDVSGTFTDNADGTYTITYVVGQFDTDWTAGNLPIVCTLEDAAENDDTANAFTDGNTLIGNPNPPGGGGGGGGNPGPGSAIFPSEITMEIDGAPVCTPLRQVRVNLHAVNATAYQMSQDPSFAAAEWNLFAGPTMQTIFTLSAGDGPKTIYVRFRSSTANVSLSYSDTVILDEATLCGLVDAPEVPVIDHPQVVQVPLPITPTPAGTCSIDCSRFTYDLYIVNPNGTERHMNSAYTRVSQVLPGLYSIAYEDKGSDFDYNDLILEFDTRYCKTLRIRHAGGDASWNHEVRLRIMIDGFAVAEQQIWPDSQAARGTLQTVNITSNPLICEAVITGKPPVDPNLPVGGGAVAGVTLYEHINFGGRSQTFFFDEEDLRFTDIGQDVASSLKVFGGASIALYEHILFGGRSLTVRGDIADLRTTALGHDIVSSLRILPEEATPVPTTPRSCTTTTEFKTFLTTGVSGAEVLALQQLLQCLGFLPSSVVPNGNYGSATVNAVTAFQAAHNISALGYVGPATRAVLNSYRTAPSAPAAPIEEPAPSEPVTLNSGCTTTRTFTTFLQAGQARGEEVQDLQVLLQCLGTFPAGTSPNGLFGATTEQAVSAFQQLSGIEPVGYVGPSTRSALNAYTKTAAPAEPAPAPEPEPEAPKQITLKDGCTSDRTFVSFMIIGQTVGEEVKDLQSLLQCLGTFPASVEPNGVFGSTTEQAVIDFQSATGIDPVGYVGPSTREVLNRY